MLMQRASKMHALQREGECNHSLNPSASGRLWVRPRSEGAWRGREIQGKMRFPGPAHALLVWVGWVRSNIINSFRDAGMQDRFFEL